MQTLFKFKEMIQVPPQYGVCMHRNARFSKQKTGFVYTVFRRIKSELLERGVEVVFGCGNKMGKTCFVRFVALLPHGWIYERSTCYLATMIWSANKKYVLGSKLTVEAENDCFRTFSFIESVTRFDFKLDFFQAIANVVSDEFAWTIWMQAFLFLLIQNIK